MLVTDIKKLKVTVISAGIHDPPTINNLFLVSNFTPKLLTHRMRLKWSDQLLASHFQSQKSQQLFRSNQILTSTLISSQQGNAGWIHLIPFYKLFSNFWISENIVELNLLCYITTFVIYKKEQKLAQSKIQSFVCLKDLFWVLFRA